MTSTAAKLTPFDERHVLSPLVGPKLIDQPPYSLNDFGSPCLMSTYNPASTTHLHARAQRLTRRAQSPKLAMSTRSGPGVTAWSGPVEAINLVEQQRGAGYSRSPASPNIPSALQATSPTGWGTISLWVSTSIPGTNSATRRRLGD
jgi:hypothetical protein